MTGRLYAGTSGFAYPGWIPRFYPADARAADLLPAYAARLSAVELNNTYYQQPSAAKVASWLATTPETFQFTVKAQRGGSSRALTDPAASVPWLTGPYRAFGARLGTVLYRVPNLMKRDDAKLAGLLAAWPRDIPIALEFQDATWHVDETFATLANAGAALVSTESPEDEVPPDIRRTGPFLYLRLRRHDYAPAEVAAWAARLRPFLDAGDDAFVFFRHDDVGRGPELALELAAAIGAESDEVASPAPADENRSR